MNAVEDKFPLVSIIVRTKNRPRLLDKALNSIAAQNYRPIEVIIVNDGGVPLERELLQNTLGNIKLNYICLEKNQGRAKAGNIGIRNASGKYIGFLDDDDELLSDHVSSLVKPLEKYDYKIAFSEAESINLEYEPDQGQMLPTNRQHFNWKFNYQELLVCNHIPFNSLLFSRDIFREIGELDEDFELYEDWDLLIRIGEQYQFFHVNKITAHYYQWDKDVQINQRDQQHMRDTHLRIIEKHKDKISPSFILDIWKEKENRDSELQYLQNRTTELNHLLTEKDSKISELEQQLMKEQSKISELEHEVIEKDSKISYLSTTLFSIQDSLAWIIIERFLRLKERVFPFGTRRRHSVDLIIKSIKLYDREGFKALFNKIYTKFFPINNGSLYAIWIKNNEPKRRELEIQEVLSKSLIYRPKISIITPVYNPPKDAFIKMIESVVNQTYDNWELCTADASSDASIRKIIESYIRKDDRIKVKYLDKNKGIAGNTNEALSMATGDFIALLDHDDTLAPFALYEVAKCISENPNVDFIYSDRDKITQDGKRFDPFFKPDWSPDYLLSQNYVCHLNVFRKDIIDKIGGFRTEYEGSQDYDLVLRVTELTNNIVHIPKVLYHWRLVKGSAANDPEAKPYAYQAAIKSLQDAVNRRDWKATVTFGAAKGLYRVIFDVDTQKKVSIIVPTKDNVKILKNCLQSILDKTLYKNYEIIIVDNQSKEFETFKYYETLKKDPKIKILMFNKPFNFSEINNFAVSKTNTEYIIFLNNDTEIITQNWIELLMGFAQRKDIGAVGAKLIYPDNTIQHAGLILDAKCNVRRSHHRYPRNSLGYGGRIQSIQNLSAVAAAAMMMRRKVFEEVGGFDPAFIVAHGDIDLCLKLRERGYLIVYEPHVEIYHYESYTRGYEDTPEKIRRLINETKILLQKKGHILKKGDSYYNPNLTPDKEDFSIRI